MSNVLVTGGAGYIGAHTAKALSARGLTPVAFDNLSSGYREAVRWGPLIEGDVRDAAAVAAAIRAYHCKAVIHFAALIEAGLSVKEPERFHDVNVGGTRAVLAAMTETGVARLVFSSTGSFYDTAVARPMREDDPIAPSNPYAETKVVAERLIGEACAEGAMSAIALRYFNASGADESGLIGEAHQPETHLIPIAVESALGLRPPLTVNGADYATPDGSCVRDYVHVSDLADAHLAALELTREAGSFRAFNVGTGRGYSVLEVIGAIGAALGRSLAYHVGPRRAGDPPAVVADPSRARDELGWTPTRSDLPSIVTGAIAWRRSPKYGRFS
ncbi:MAG TPA: UDP-glucose 4-epimerase GalE [Caulobacteraceae bacterium]|nr:UDP-glucose 4-epimerase GalE [Caulobacteraceae bacterium]